MQRGKVTEDTWLPREVARSHSFSSLHAHLLHLGRLGRPQGQASQPVLGPVPVMTGLLETEAAHLWGAAGAVAQLLDAAGISGSRILSMPLLLQAGALHESRGGVVVALFSFCCLHPPFSLW